MTSAGRRVGHNAVDLVETNLVAPAIVELRGARRRVVRHHRGLFQRAAVFEVSRDSRRPEAVVPEFGGDASRRRGAGGSSHRRLPAAALCG